MAQLGFRYRQRGGRAGRLAGHHAGRAHWKAHKLDLSPVLHEPESAFMNQDLVQQLQAGPRPRQGTRSAVDRDEPRGAGLPEAGPSFSTTIANVNRTVGTMLGHEVTKAYGGQGLPDGTIDITFTARPATASARSCRKGITLRVYGDANDYVGKGLSGGRIVCGRPNAPSDYVAERQHHRRQRHPVRRHQRAGVPARAGRRAVRRAQLRRTRGGRGRRRPRLRVHDRRPGGDSRAHRPQLRGRHVRRRRLRLRPRRDVGSQPQLRDGRSSALDEDDVEWLHDMLRGARRRSPDSAVGPAASCPTGTRLN